MFLRLFVSGFIAFFLGAMLFLLTVTLYPQGMEVLAPAFCDDWQDFEITGDFSGVTPETQLRAACTGDGTQIVNMNRVYVAAVGLYCLPIFLLFWVRFASKGRRRKEKRKNMPEMPFNTGYYSTSNADNLDWARTASNMTAFVMNSASVNPDKLTQTIQLVQEAARDGVITQQEFERIAASLGNGTFSQQADVSLTTRLTELQSAFDQGLITTDEYNQKRRDILDAY